MQNLNFLIENGVRWVKRQRALHRPAARPLPSDAREALGRFFRAATLDAVRVGSVQAIPSPDFYEELLRAGLDTPLDFSRMDGIAFDDTVLITASAARRPDRLALLFHECVHVAQYAALGVDRFLEAYVAGWASSGQDYYAIPLEREAYALQRRFEAAPHAPFSVEAQVAPRLSEPIQAR